MTTPLGPTIFRHYALALLILCVCPTHAFGQVPESTIQRIVELNIEAEENSALSAYKQIDDRSARSRRGAIDAERRTLYRQLARLSADVQRQANSQIKGLTKARLAILQPQWQARGEQFKEQQAQHVRGVTDALRSDVRAALEPQRRRLLLQQRRDRGEITPQEFAVEDKRALDEIMALRDKYARQDQIYGDRFDHELKLMSQAIAKDPAIAIPVSQVSEGKGGTSPGDYQRDVALAVTIYGRWTDVRNRWGRKEVDDAAYRETERIFSADIARLQRKWQAAGKGPEFERDYRQPRAQTVLGAAAPPLEEGTVREARVARQIIGKAVLILVVIGAWGVYRLFRRKPVARRQASTVHGSAHYAPLEADIRDEACLAKGLFLGKSSQPAQASAPLDAPGAPICSTPEHHTLIVARTRTGKGTRVIVPTLLRYAGSALVIDPKGENAAITAAIRRNQLSQSIHILNPWNELATVFAGRGLAQATYNPLDILDRHDPNAVAVAQALAGAVCPAPANAKDRFWQGSAANIFAAVLLWLADRPDETKTLGRARQVVSLTRQDFKANFLIPMAASEGFGGAIREMAAPFIDLADETYSGIMSNLSESTKFLSDPQIKAATATSSFSMDELSGGKATVYVVIPTDRMDTQKTWLRLVIAAGMHTFKHPKSRLPSGHRCLFLIDEFAALGRLDDLPRDIATMSGFGVDFALVVQGLDQLKDHYGDARATILSNCAYKWFCNVNDLDSARYVSETLGKKTVETTSTSDSVSASGHGSSSGHSTTTGETGRSLLNPDEVLNLGKDVAIAIQPHGHPHYLRPIDYWNLAEAFSSLREKHPGLYWDPPLMFHENPYFTPPPPPGGDKRQNGGAGGNGRARSEVPRRRSPKMTEDEARNILGIGANATPEEIGEAYRRLMKKVHPDLGGSKHFAQELNAAKAVLLGE